MTQLRLLDLFCGAGGAGMGYFRAGFAVTGVDIEAQSSYPFPFIRSDAFAYLHDHGHEYDLIHASPPCQYYSRASRNNPAEMLWYDDDLLTRACDQLRASGKSYVIENVEDAKYSLNRPVILCGTMFGLKLYRHRAFEVSFPVTRLVHPRHVALVQRNSYLPTPERPFMTVTGRNGHHSKRWIRTAAEYLGVPWAADNLNGVVEAIPPDYTEYIGRQYLAALESEAA